MMITYGELLQTVNTVIAIINLIITIKVINEAKKK